MSENFVVSARKYRPATFKTVVGQDHITTTLKKAILSKHLAQAYLFTGPRGVGKTTCARILAKAINCENLEADGEPCNSCQSCKTFIEQRSMNIFELDAASNNSVDDIRALVDQVRFSPQAGKYKTYIIDEVHMLSTSAFNAFLKTLEEPPPYAIFILATTEKHKIIPTILSRCQINDFNRIQVKDIATHLQHIATQEKIQAEAAALHIIAQKADGALRDALTIFDRIVSFTQNEITYDFVVKNLNIIDYEYFFKATDHIIQKDISSLLLTFDELLNKGFEGQNLLMGLSEHYRNILVSILPGTDVLLDMPETVKGRFVESASKLSKSFLLSALNILNQFNITYKESKNQRLHTELALIKLCHLNDAIDLVNSMQDQKKKPESGIVTAIPEKKQTSSEKPEESPQKETSIVKEKNGLSSIKNLDDVQKQIKQEESVKNSLVEEKNVSDLPTEESESNIDKEKFLIAWAGYLDDKLAGQKINLYNSLKSKPPEFTGEKTVKITFENKALEEMFQKEKMKLNQYLNEKHNIQNIKITTELRQISNDEKSVYLVNPKEKYMHLKEKNPELENLQKLLDLSAEE